MIAHFRRFMSYFGQGFQKYIAWIVVGGVFIALLETVSVVMILPLMALVLDPQEAVKTGVLGWGYQLCGSPDYKTYIIIVSLFIGGLYIFRAAFQVLFTRWEHYIFSKWRVSISHGFYRSFMNASYSYHSKNTSSGIISIITSIIPNVVNGFAYQFMSLLCYLIVGLFLSVFLAVGQPVVTAVVAVFLVTLYQGQKKAIRKKIQKLGVRIAEASERNILALQQGTGSFKETKINLKESYFESAFVSANSDYTKSDGKMSFYQRLPIPMTEMIVMISVIVAFNMIVAAGESASSITQELAVLVMTMFRLIPVVNRSLTSVSMMNGALGSLQVLIKEADAIGYRPVSTQKPPPEEAPLALTSSLVLEKVSYSYPKAETPVLSDISLRIDKGEFVGIIGPSGAGKTTLVALLLGFLQAQHGQYRVDGAEVTPERIRSLRHTIGYVDQSPFFFNASIQENVAFGVEAGDIDPARVETALRQAELWDVVCSLDGGMTCPIGENGKRLSSGQRQRLALARALYKQPSLLILDEATSALDVETEHRISNTVQSLKASLTIVAIAHRLATLRACDRLIMMEHGRIVETGSYDELMARNEAFRRLVALSRMDHALP